ncbi:scavenger receptor class B member 1 isoform X1 [Neocloeon triangulifer]|uniref:scavenger receptor class B member 1 isoform X1 n=1 Tax=Neocloeon triangulifer TaxID=2078957 RepID=UPI00286F81D7|nr:scavenger receptor class B member 1 isoform X1 [Neocloeon triangulifer]
MQRAKFLDKLKSGYLRKWWLVILVSLVLLSFGALVAVFFSQWVQFFIGHEITLRQGSQTFKWWRQPPIEPLMKIYIYNVTNADEFLIDGAKPIVQELGPYVYRQEWERVNVEFHDNATVTFQQRKVFYFDAEASAGDEEDMVVVPNIPMLSATSQSKHAARFLRLAMASIMDILKIKPFVEVSVSQLLWGYEDPLLKLAKDVVSKDQKLPYEEFGLFYGKNGTSNDILTVFTGKGDITRYGLIDRFNGKTHLPHYKTESCNRLNGSDGSLFPPNITPNTTLYVWDKDMCRLLPLHFQKEVVTNGDVLGYRFSPPENVFYDPEHNPENDCFCPQGPPCAPNGLFNVSACQYDSPIMLSFPHFYQADPELLKMVDGISPPEKEKHQLFIDVQPQMGTTLRATARVQINLAVSQVVDIKQVATFPDIIFPILWFEDVISGLPGEVTDLLHLATNAPAVAKSALSFGLFVIGGVLLVISVFCLIRNSNRQETLTLESSTHYVNKPPNPRPPRNLIPPFPNGTPKKEPVDVLNPGFVADSNEMS